MLINLIRDYNNNIPLIMLSNKYKLGIHEIVRILYKMKIEAYRGQSID